MHQAISYGSKKYKSLKISFSKDNRMKDILAILMQLELPLKRVDRSNWEFVVLELLTNAIRASVERKTEAKIIMHLKLENSFFYTYITDGAGGFDLESLPYDIFEDADKIDVFSKHFEQYRLYNDYKRYGLGLFSAKKFADEFDIFFIDNEGQQTRNYAPGSLFGTFISIKKRTEG
ncbi:MAG: hypothetical protein CVV50_01615 [Spirochaetae bacterium HGW-Spirochaetae-6]|nr:MAG: hypothetical protein CVV50_01615 [Spirochaetae bacterium HGW-Spirochaetae-6]